MLSTKQLCSLHAIVVGLIGFFAFSSLAQGPQREPGPAINRLPMLRYLVRAKLDAAQSRLVVLVDALTEKKDVTVDDEGKIVFPAGRIPRTVALEHLRLFRPDGSEAPWNAAQDSLKSIQPVFFFDNFAGDVIPISKTYSRVVGENCWIVVTHLSIRPRETGK